MVSLFHFPEDRFSRRVLWISLALHLICAFFSAGYYQFDEHFQILEWAGMKLDMFSADKLAWEHAAGIRSWFQPAIAFVVAKLISLFGEVNPFSLATTMRMLSSVLGWIAIVGTVNCTRFWFPDVRIRKLAICAISLLWFLPLLHARFSSEGWSGTLFALGLLPWLHEMDRQKCQKESLNSQIFLLSGMLWGFAFQCRFQSLILLFFAVVWFIVFSSKKSSVLLYSFFGFLTSLLLASLIDRWGYGYWSFPAFDYVRVNLIEGKAVEFGREPFWFYALNALREAPPLSTLLFLATMATWGVARRFSLTWITAGFFLVHSILAHKESRFLFPIYPLIPVVAVMLFQKVSWVGEWYKNNCPSVLKTAVIFLNGLYLIPILFFPVRTEMSVIEKLWQLNLDKVYVGERNPYSLPEIEAKFYQRPTMTLSPLKDLPQGSAANVLCVFPDECGSIISKSRDCRDFGGGSTDFLRNIITQKVWNKVKLVEWHVVYCEAIGL